MTAEPEHLRKSEKNLTLQLKLIKLQRNDEICVGVNAAKAERIGEMAYGEIKALLLKYRGVLSAVRMGNQQRSLEQRNVQRLSCGGVEMQAIGISKRWAPPKGWRYSLCFIEI